MPGYVGIVTHEDAPDLDWHGVWFNYIGHIFDGLARFGGDEIGAVAAKTPGAAEEALSLIEVEYEDLPAVFDADEALAPGRAAGAGGRQRPRAQRLRVGRPRRRQDGGRLHGRRRRQVRQPADGARSAATRRSPSGTATG